MTQKTMVFQYLQDHVGITSLEAINNLGVLRLSARIKELRDEGHKIINVRHDTVNRYGSPCHYDEYRLIK